MYKPVTLQGYTLIIDGKELKTGYVERALELPQGYILANYDHDPALRAVLKIVAHFPNILDVADNEFTPQSILEFLIKEIQMSEAQQEPLRPTIGCIVYYTRFGSPGGEHKPEPSPAIITKVEEDGYTCHLFVMNPNGCYFNLTKFSEEPKPGCWSWPKR